MEAENTEDQKPVKSDAVILEEQPTNTLEETFKGMLPYLTAYIVGGWSIIQFIDWFTGRNEWSPYWVDISFWLFVLFLPAICIISYRQESDLPIFKGWKVKLALVLNMLLVSGVLFGAYGNKDLGRLTQAVSFEDEQGEEQTISAAKEENTIPLFVFPFDVKPVNDSLQDIAYGTAFLLWCDLEQNKYVLVSEPIVYPYTEALKCQYTINEDFYFDGEITSKEEGYEIIVYKRQGGKSKILSEKTFTGSDIFVLVDSVSVHILKNSGLTDWQIKNSLDMSVAAYVTDNESVIPHLKIDWYNPDNMMEDLRKATELDSSCSVAWSLAGFINVIKNKFGYGREEAIYAIDRSIEYSSRVPQEDKLFDLFLKYYLNENTKKSVAIASAISRIDQEAESGWIGDYYLSLGQFKRYYEILENQYEKTLSEWMKIKIGVANLYVGNDEKALSQITDYYNLATSGYGRLVTAQLALDKYEDAYATLADFSAKRPELETGTELYKDCIEYAKSRKDPKSVLSKFAAFFKSNQSDRSFRFLHHRFFLIGADFNNTNLIMLPASDDEVRGVYDHSWKLKLWEDENGEQLGLIAQDVATDDPPILFWKQDSMIRLAERELYKGNLKEARAAYRTSLENNPQHYYLQLALDHLDFASATSSKQLVNNYLDYTGTFGIGEKQIRIKCDEERERLLLFRYNHGRESLYPINELSFISLGNYSEKYTFSKNEVGELVLEIHKYDLENGTWTIIEKLEK
ncbi:MAG: hypothetical protein AAF741_01910 [Bacteroidota bacterium]